VPYASLHYPIHWRDQIPELLFTELESCDHAETSNVEEFFSILVEHSCEKYGDAVHVPSAEQKKESKEIPSPGVTQKRAPMKEVLERCTHAQLLSILGEISSDKKYVIDSIANFVDENPELSDLVLAKVSTFISLRKENLVDFSGKASRSLSNPPPKKIPENHWPYRNRLP